MPPIPQQPRNPPYDDVIPLRPYGLGEVLTGAFRVYRRASGRMLLAGLTAAIPLAVVAVLLTIHAHPDGGRVPKNWRGDALVGAGGLVDLYCFGVAGLLALLLAAGYPGRGVGAWGRVLRRVPTLATVWVASAMATLFLTSTGIGIPVGIWIYVRWAMAPYVALAEGLDSVSALRRSWHLVDTHWWQTFGTLIVLNLIVGLVPDVLLTSFTALADEHHGVTTAGVVVLVIGVLLSAVLLPLSGAGTALIYLDLRARKEGLAYMLEASRRDPEVRPAFGRGSVYSSSTWGSEGR